MNAELTVVRETVRKMQQRGEETIEDFVTDYLDREREENAREAGEVDLTEITTLTEFERRYYMSNKHVEATEAKRVDTKMAYDGAVIEDAKHDRTLGQQKLVSWKKLANTKFDCPIKFNLYKKNLKVVHGVTGKELFTVLIGKDKETIYGITPLEALAYVVEEQTVIN